MMFCKKKQINELSKKEKGIELNSEPQTQPMLPQQVGDENDRPRSTSIAVQQNSRRQTSNTARGGDLLLDFEEDQTKKNQDSMEFGSDLEFDSGESDDVSVDSFSDNEALPDIKPEGKISEI